MLAFEEVRRRHHLLPRGVGRRRVGSGVGVLHLDFAECAARAAVVLSVLRGALVQDRSHVKDKQTDAAKDGMYMVSGWETVGGVVMLYRDAVGAAMAAS